MTQADKAWPDLAGRFEGKTHILPVRIYYEDTDFSGLVYHTSYLRFAERGRSDFLRLAGISHRELFRGEMPLAFAIQRMEIDFVRPARIDDCLEVHTRYVRAYGARVDALQRIIRAGTDEEMWRADVRVVCIDGKGRPRRLPPSVNALLADFLDDPPLVGVKQAGRKP